MTWRTRYGKHISQIHPSTSLGAGDCGPASLTRYLYEAGRIPPQTDPWTALARVAEVVRGVPDSPYDNSVTDSNALIIALGSYGIRAGVAWTDSYQRCLASPWSIILVRGPDLLPEPCPQSYWGTPPQGSGDHWMLWLPYHQGSAAWFNNPLQTIPGQIDAQTDLRALPGAFYGGIVLPTTGCGETEPTHWKALRQFGLLTQPQHGSTSLATVPKDGTGLTSGETHQTGTDIWQKCQFRDKYGWTLHSYLTYV